MLLDLHTHILPGIDDGARSPEISAKMLEMLKKDGVTDVVLTPHFYWDQQSVEKFLEKRAAAYGKLLAVAPEGIRLHLGAEVEFYGASIDHGVLRDLAIDGGQYILLELPFLPEYKPNLFAALRQFIYTTDLTPIVAHVERYPAIQRKPSHIAELVDLGCLIQVNAASVIDCKKWSLADVLFLTGQAHFLGTDAHNTDTRRPNYRAARETVREKYGAECIEYLDRIASCMMEGKRPTVNRSYKIKKTLFGYR